MLRGDVVGSEAFQLGGVVGGAPHLDAVVVTGQSKSSHYVLLRRGNIVLERKDIVMFRGLQM
jgi:hypothetical protein